MENPCKQIDVGTTVMPDCWGREKQELEYLLLRARMLFNQVKEMVDDKFCTIVYLEGESRDWMKEKNALSHKISEKVMVKK